MMIHKRRAETRGCQVGIRLMIGERGSDISCGREVRRNPWEVEGLMAWGGAIGGSCAKVGLGVWWIRARGLPIKRVAAA